MQQEQHFERVKVFLYITMRVSMRAIDVNGSFISVKERFKSTRENRPIQSFELELLDLPAHTKNELAPSIGFGRVDYNLRLNTAVLCSPRRTSCGMPLHY